MFLANKAFLSVLLICLAGAVHAMPVTWIVSTAPAPSGLEQPIGEFTYDADTGVTSQWNIDGFFYPSCPGGPPCPNHGGGVSPSGTLATFFEISSFEYYALDLEFASPLTDAGGTIALVPGSCVVCSGPGFNGGSTVSGSGLIQFEETTGNGFFTPFAAGIASAPEPALGVGVFFALTGMLTFRRYRNQKAGRS